MKILRGTVVALLATGLPVSALAGFGFGFSDNGFDTWDPEDYPYSNGYPRNSYERWGWGDEYRRFMPSNEPDNDWGSSWGRSKHRNSSGWSDWGSDEPKRLKFGTGKFDFGDSSWSPSFGKSWGRGRPFPPPPPYGYYPPAPPAWGGYGYGYPPAPAWGGYAAPMAPPAPPPAPAPQQAPAEQPASVPQAAPAPGQPAKGEAPAGAETAR